MDSHTLERVKRQNPDEKYPYNLGKLWTTEEENTLLQELDKNINIEIIAQNHNRTIGGIKGKQQNIAYNMHLKNVSIEEIMTSTKLEKEQIIEIIAKKQVPNKKLKTTPEPILEPKKNVLENEISALRSEIKELKNTVTELVSMIKAVYEFENSA